MRVIEGCLEKVRSEKVTTYVSDYIEALKLDHLQNSEYAKTARSLLKEYSEEFNQNSDQTCQDSRTFEYIRRKKAYVRGVGFFSSENPFAELFESACRRRNYTVSVRGKKQSTYFSFLPPMPTTLLRALDYSGIHQTQLSGLVSSLVSFTFRFLHDKDLLVLSFALGPPNNENKELREKIYLCRKAIWKLNIGHPVERAGRIHTGIYRKNFRFDTSNWSGSLSLSEGVEDLFESKVSPFVDKIYLAIEGCLLNPSDGGET